MSKDQTYWEPDIDKAVDIAKNIKLIKQQLKDDADRRTIDGFNPTDVTSDKK